MAWLKCLWSGHQVKASVSYVYGKRPITYLYHCTRCRRILAGPRP